MRRSADSRGSGFWRKGYAGKVLRINLSNGSYKIEPLDMKEARQYIGGRGFNAAKLYKEVPSGTDPLGPDNKLMVATGPLVGTMFPTAGRFAGVPNPPVTPTPGRPPRRCPARPAIEVPG